MRRWRQLPVLAMFMLALCTARVPANEDLVLLESLIERRLFSLAEYYCQQRIHDTSLDVTAQGDFARGLIRNYSEQSRYAPPGEREAIWQRAEQVLRDFERRHGENPQVLLVRFQAALAKVARGEIAYEEFARWKQSASVNEPSLRVLSDAVRELEVLKEDIVKAVRERGRAAFAVGRLSDEQLRLLQGHVQFYLVKALQLQAESFPPGSPDRVLAAASALEHARQLAPADVPDALWWENRLRAVQCHRLKEDWPTARHELGRLEPLAPGDVERLDVRAELLRIALAQGRVDEALSLITQGRELEGVTSPHLDLAHLETYLHLWDRSREMGNADQQDWQSKAMQLVALIQSEHGPRWARLAVLLTADRFGAQGLSSDIEAQVAVAEEYFRQGEFQQSVAAFDGAAAEAERQALNSAAFELSYRAAVILHEQGRRTDAARRFRAMSLRAPDHARAAHAHWISVLDAARLAHSSSDLLAAYEAQLNEHLQHWPNADSANQARWWLARLYEGRQQWKDAAQLYLTGHGPEDPWAAAILRGAHCWDKYLATVNDSTDKALQKDLGEALKQLQSVAATQTGDGRQMPQRVVDAALLGSALLQVHYAAQLPSDAIAELSARVSEYDTDDPAWQAEARRVLLTASIRQKNFEQARALVPEMQVDDPSELLAWMLRMGQRDEFLQQPLAAELLLELGARWQSDPGVLSEAEQAAWQRLRARCLAAAGQQKLALEGFAELAAQNPNDSDMQRAYGRLLLQAGTPASRNRALEQWRKILARSRPASDLWFEAKLAIAQTHLEMGEPQQAVEIIELVRAIYPTLGGETRRAEFEELLVRSRRAVSATNR